MLAALDGGDNSLKVLFQEACADHWGQSNALNVQSTAQMLSTVIEVLAFSPCLSIGHCKKYNFHKLIQPCIPDKHGFKLIFSPLFFFLFLRRRRKEVIKKALATDIIKHRRGKQNLSSKRWHLNEWWTRQLVNTLVLCFMGCLSLLRFLTWRTVDCPLFLKRQH